MSVVLVGVVVCCLLTDADLSAASCPVLLGMVPCSVVECFTGDTAADDQLLLLIAVVSTVAQLEELVVDPVVDPELLEVASAS